MPLGVTVPSATGSPSHGAQVELTPEDSEPPRFRVRVKLVSKASLAPGLKPADYYHGALARGDGGAALTGTGRLMTETAADAAAVTVLLC